MILHHRLYKKYSHYLSWLCKAIAYNIHYFKKGSPIRVMIEAEVDDVLEFIDLVLKHYPAWSYVFAKGVTLETKVTEDNTFIPYICRHTCASRLLQRGANLVVVKEWLGHAKIKTTMRYAHLSADNLSDARDTLEAKTTDKTSDNFVITGAISKIMSGEGGEKSVYY